MKKRAGTKPSNPPLPPTLKTIPRFGLDIHGWRKTDANVTFARALFSDPNFQMMIDVLRNHVPYVSVHAKLDDIGAARELGRVNGYRECLGILESLPLWEKEKPTDAESEFPEEDNWSEPET